MDERRQLWIPGLAFAAHLALTLYAAGAILHDFPVSGDEYVYEATGCLAIVGAVVLARLPTNVLAAALTGLLVWDAASFVSISRDVSKVVRRRQTLEKDAASAGLARALVFVTEESGAELFANAARNGIDFDGSVLYVRDLGTENQRLLGAYPDRSAYRYTYDMLTGRGQLLALPPARKAAP